MGLVCGKLSREIGMRWASIRFILWGMGGGLDFGRIGGVETILCVLLFPLYLLYPLAKEAWVEDVWSHSGGGVWAPRFSRRLNDWEVFDLERFLLRLQGRRVYNDVEDQVVWTKVGHYHIKFEVRDAYVRRGKFLNLQGAMRVDEVER